MLHRKYLTFICFLCVAELMLPYWVHLDSDGSGLISNKEWNEFFDKLEKSQLGQTMAEEGESLVVDLFMDGGFTIRDVS